MNLEELKNIQKTIYPNDEFEYIFDNFCIRETMVKFWDGKPLFNVHVSYDKVKIILKGRSSYLPCSEKREMPFMEFRTKFMEGVCEIPPEYLDKLKKAFDQKNLNRPYHGYEETFESIKQLSGQSEEYIKQKAGIA